MNLSTFPLKSTGISRLLLWLLRIVVIVASISTLQQLISVISPAPFSIFVTWQNLLKSPLISFSFLCIHLAILPLSLIWIYRLHHDLCRCYHGYPIDAWDALWRFILPGYNIWGIWNTLRTIGRYFQAETGRLNRLGMLLSRLVPVLYSIFIGSYLLEQLLYNYDYLGRIESIKNLPDSIISIAQAGTQLLELAGVIILLLIAQIIIHAMQLKAAQMSDIKKINHWQ
jgi:hypothetical protein